MYSTSLRRSATSTLGAPTASRGACGSPVLLRWFSFFLAYHLMLLSALVILRRQWVEHERLAYPVAQVPLAMLQDNGSPDAIIKPFFKNPVMWAGFIFSFLMNSTNILNNYFPWIPAFMGQVETLIFRDQIELTFRINFLMLGFAYFINTGVAFGMWFFYIVRVLQGGIFAILDINLAQDLGPGAATRGVGGDIFGHQMMGALIVLVVFGLWTARPHLKEVLHKAWNKDAPVDDSREIMSYRAAVLCFLGGVFFVFFLVVAIGHPGLDRSGFYLRNPGYHDRVGAGHRRNRGCPPSPPPCRRPVL